MRSSFRAYRRKAAWGNRELFPALLGRQSMSGCELLTSTPYRLFLLTMMELNLQVEIILFYYLFVILYFALLSYS